MSASLDGTPASSPTSSTARVREPDRLRVAVSMLSLVPGGMGGSETYAKELVGGLTVSPNVAVSTIVPGNAAGFTTVSNEKAISFVRARPSTIGRLRALASALLATKTIRSASADADVVHFPFTVCVPKPARRQATVLTVHDVQHRELPQLFSFAEKLFRVFAYEIPARRADIVVTVSEFARDGIQKHLRVPADRIRVVPLGVDTSLFKPFLGPRENFVMYPARGWPHKNHTTLFKAMEIVRLKSPSLKLVLTGGNLDSLGELPEWVDRRGLVPRAELLELYRSASAMVFPSLYEGFGLPPLEAMASGCPVAASNAGSIPEVCGEAAVLFDPHDPADIARGILEAIEGGSHLAERGIEHAAQFSWQACVDGHIAAFRDAERIHTERYR